ncbi:MAG: DUF309 domain-containing protein [Leptolyngbyaceae cyanobacterium]
MNTADSSLNTSQQPSDFWLGIEQFNQGEYYACHDTLEAIWMDAQTINKGFYQGILQISVGLYHLTNLNWQGAAILLGEGIHRLDAYEDSYGGINVASFVEQVIQWLTVLQETGPEQVQQVANTLLARSGSSENQDSESRQVLPIPHIVPV